MQPVKKTCESCNKPFETPSVDQTLCIQCMIKPRSYKSFNNLKEDMMAESLCITCQAPFTKEFPNQKFCTDCRDKKASPTPLEALDKVDTSNAIQGAAKKLMDLAGVRKMLLCYDTFQVTIERL